MRKGSDKIIVMRSCTHAVTRRTPHAEYHIPHTVYRMLLDVYRTPLNRVFIVLRVLIIAYCLLFNKSIYYECSIDQWKSSERCHVQHS